MRTYKTTTFSRTHANIVRTIRELRAVLPFPPRFLYADMISSRTERARARAPTLFLLCRPVSRSGRRKHARAALCYAPLDVFNENPESGSSLVFHKPLSAGLPPVTFGIDREFQPHSPQVETNFKNRTYTVIRVLTSHYPVPAGNKYPQCQFPTSVPRNVIIDNNNNKRLTYKLDWKKLRLQFLLSATILMNVNNS